MAVGGSYDPTATNIRSSFASLMKSFPEIKEVFFDEFKMYPTLYTSYCDVDSSKKNIERENTVGGRGIWTTKTEADEFTYGDYAQGTEINYTHATYTDAFDVSEELMEDNQTSGIMASAKEMARGGYAAAETSAVAILDDAFTGGSTGTDGGQLCASNHDLINSASTGDNAETLALGVDGLKAMYQLADNIVNEANLNVPVEYTTLVVPPELRQMAEELAGSALSPVNANNAINVYKNRIKKIVVNPFLSSSTAWFLVAPSLKKKGRFLWRVKPMFRQFIDQDSGNLKYQARERYSTGHTDWQAILGSTGAT
ncbi:hypothetical protein KAU11_07230 [Candidatus Babeliales bacterium]|nr:hypothetical protein [Candidatus Babeliales bacterium]